MARLQDTDTLTLDILLKGHLTHFSGGAGDGFLLTSTQYLPPTQHLSSTINPTPGHSFRRRAMDKPQAERIPNLRAGEHNNRELAWLPRFGFLKSRGYLLRPRYRPGWKAPWGPEDDITVFEEAITPQRVHVLDAARISDGLTVFLKVAPKSTPEIDIGRYLRSDELRKDPDNHSIPLLDVLETEAEPDIVILVLPVLRRLDSPDFASAQEAADFVQQTLEGLIFLHKHQIAHRDCAWENIMMDGRHMFPSGWHPQEYARYPNGTFLGKKASPSRTAAGVRYYFIDFGIATHRQDLTTGLHGQERAPELSDTVPYDPYKLDVYILGMAYTRFLILRHHGADFLQPLVQYMTRVKPEDRPSAVEALEKFRSIRAKLSERDLARRLLRTNALQESTFTQILSDFSCRLQDYLWTRSAKKELPPLDP